MKQISKVCGHEYEHEGWPTDELCPTCYFAEMDTDEAYYKTESLCEEMDYSLEWQYQIGHCA